MSHEKNEQSNGTKSAPTKFARGTFQDEIQATEDKITRVPVMNDEIR